MSMRLFVPDMPCADALLPWLRRLDVARQYANFGPLVREFEALLAAQWPVGPAAGDLRVCTTGSGTQALELGLAALELPPGGEVLMPAYTFAATAAAALRQGLRPVWADVDAATWQLTPAMAKEALRRRRLALVMPVATFGLPLDVAAWDAFCDETGVPVLFDAAPAFGNQAIGRRAHAAFSLHATKPFGVGEGGLLATRDARVAARARQLSNFGFQGGCAAMAGGNAKMSEYAAAVGLCQWARRASLRERRRALWTAWLAESATLAGCLGQQGFRVDGPLPAALVLSLPLEAGVAAAALRAQGIETRRWYWPALPQHPAFQALPAAGGLAETARLAEHALGLPWHAFLDAADLARLAGTLRELVGAVASTPSARVDA